MDIIFGMLVVFVVAFVAAVGSGDIIGWLRGEWRRMRAHTFEPQELLTHEDPRCKAVAARLLQAKLRMDRNGTKRLLTGRPAWQKVVTNEDLQPKVAAKIVPLRTRGH